MIPVLRTKRLTLRPGRLEDADALHTLWGDPHAMRWWSHPPHATIEQSRAKMDAVLSAAGWRFWAVTRTDDAEGDGRAIGTLSVHAHRPGVAEIGYGFARRYWGDGLGQESVSALLDQLFRAERHRRVFADTDPDNAGSNRLLERLAFTCEGRLRAEWETHLGVRDSLIWGLLADEWISSSASTRA